MVATIILGGGLSGLAAAHELSQLRVGTVNLLEKESELGGMDRTFVHEGVRFTPGSQTLMLSENDPTYAFLRRLMGEAFKLVPATSSYSMAGVEQGVTCVESAFKQLPLRQRSQVWGLHGMQRLRDSLFESELNTARDAWILQFGKAAYDLIVGPYYTKLWGGDGCAGIVANGSLNPHRVRRHFNPVVDAFDFDAVSPVPQAPVAPNSSRAGVGRIVKHLIDRIDSSLTQLLTNSPVERIEWADGRVQSVLTNQHGHLRQLCADEYISSLPLTALIGMLVPSPPESVMLAAAALQFRAQVLVTLLVRNPNLNADECIYAVDPAFPYLRYGNTRDEDSDAGAVTPITFEYACNKDDEVWNASDADLAQRSWAPNQERFRTRRQTDLAGFKVHRFAHGLSMHKLNYEDKLDHVLRFLGSLRNLRLAGASGNFAVGSIPYSLESGICAARTLADAQGKKPGAIHAHS